MLCYHMALCCKSLVTEGLILITNFMTDLMSCMHAIVCRIYRIYGLGFMVHGLELRLYVLGLGLCRVHAIAVHLQFS